MKFKYFFRIFVAFSFITLIIESKNYAQIILLNEMPRPLYYERTHRIKKFKDMKCVGDIIHSDKYLMRYGIFSGNISQNIGRVIISESDNYYEIRNATSFQLRTRVVEEFYISTTFYKDWNPNARTSWIPDYSYSFGRYNWRPKTWSYGYENYAPNKYSDSSKEFLLKFLQGNYFISYNNGLLQNLIDRIHNGNSNLIITPFFRYSFSFIDNNQNVLRGLGKPNMGLSLRYNIWKRFYAEGALYAYVSPKYKQPWDPDYTYGFGYFDYRPFRLSFTYGNWVINRFPWNEKPFPNYGFLDGNFKFIFNWAW
ncbi:MAG: hypothetical protein H0V01_09420 [Bacteroidetes bacterium]|nr:hypothetical protein [Bacteroidota bacterium]HET6243040.1 hypothetical protein [Bacteroidia bacterium]